MKISVGDYLVHKKSGIGRALAIEDRLLDGVLTPYVKTELVYPVHPFEQCEVMSKKPPIHIYPITDAHISKYVRKVNGAKEFRIFITKLVDGVGVPPKRNKLDIDTEFFLNLFDWEETAEQLSFLYSYLYHSHKDKSLFFLSDHRVYDNAIKYIAHELCFSKNNLFTVDDVICIIEMALFIGHHNEKCEECCQTTNNIAKASMPICREWLNRALEGNVMVFPSITKNLPCFLLNN